MPMGITLAPNSLKTSGAELYAAPFAQSTTILKPAREILSAVALINSIYLPAAFSILLARPTSSLPLKLVLK